MAAWTYLLRCADGSSYVGCTTNLDQRIGDHQAGTHDGYTAARRPVEVVWTAEVQHVSDAIDMERRIKGWSRAKKEALITSNWRALKALSSRASRRDPSDRSSA